MKWKAIVAVLIFLGIVGLLFATEIGKKYADFMSKNVGNFVSVILKRQPSGQPFKMILTANKNSFYGQSYSITNSSFSGEGFYQRIKLGNMDMNIKTDNKISVKIINFNGLFEYTKEGGIKLTGDASQMEIGDNTYSPDSSTRIELEIVPTSFSLTNIAQDGISLQSVTGEIKTDKGQAPIQSSKLEISSFVGDFTLAEDTGVKLEGTVTSVTGDNFSFK